MSLQGNLSDLPISDLLNIITRKHNNGLLQVTYGNANQQYRATVLVREAELHAAWFYESGQETIKVRYFGEDAIQALLVCEEGDFVFELLPGDYQFAQRNINSTIREMSLASIFKAAEFHSLTPSPLSARPNPVQSLNRSARPSPLTAPTISEPRYSRFSNIASQPEPVANTTPKPEPLVARPAPKNQHRWISSLIARLRSI